MADKTTALVLYARRVPSLRGAAVETVAKITGAIGTLDNPSARGIGRWLSFLDRNSYASLSYVNDWLEAFRSTQRLDAVACNIVDWSTWPKIRKFATQVPLIVVLHSAAGDDISLITRLSATLAHRRGKLLTFFGNEYTRMPEKIAFARSVEADYIASQLPLAAARWLYGECPKAQLLAAPAALNPKRYHPLNLPRAIDIGFRGDRYPLFIGDDERTRIIDFCEQHAARYGLRPDIKYARVSGADWQAFLAQCHGIVGAESGTYYLERDDRTERAIKKFLVDSPLVTFAEVHARFFAHYVNPVSGKAISSRHFEAIGTETCQVLIDGHYNGILRAGEHFIGVRPDLSNIDDAIAQFKDVRLRQRIATQTHDYARDQHTYAHRVDSLLNAVLT